MAENLFKDQSISAIEACLSKALTDLVGKDVNVVIKELKTSGSATGIAQFDVHASHKIWAEEELSF